MYIIYIYILYIYIYIASASGRGLPGPVEGVSRRNALADGEAATLAIHPSASAPEAAGDLLRTWGRRIAHQKSTLFQWTFFTGITQWIFNGMFPWNCSLFVTSGA